MQFCKLTGSANVFFKFIFECRQSITLEDMEAPNLCRPPLGDASNGAPLGDISNVDHHSRMTPVPMPASLDLTLYGSHCERVNLASNTNIARKKK
uniref:Uncharacterized protein n=1 Tax=Aegilops tauschii subsp. strangulata TaxID=200361 RepID=A0A453KTR8_AEGTS